VKLLETSNGSVQLGEGQSFGYPFPLQKNKFAHKFGRTDNGEKSHNRVYMPNQIA
jgi:hypothetical protein